MDQNSLAQLLQHHRGSFAQVIPVKADDRLLALHFTEANTALNDAILHDVDAFSAYIDEQLRSHDARYGIGGYGEHRTIYSRSALFDGAEEPRRLHLGVDIWGPAGTPVMAPLDGVVHSFGNHPQYGDYGAVIILQHYIDGVQFHSLYGHLDTASVISLKEGQKIEKGMPFARLGPPAENGHWPPHLHFQLITDMQGYRGDYPGVCRYSERESYLQHCPDPNIILDLEGRITDPV